MKSTAIAPANIAFIKYWGKADAALRLPYNSSLSMNLSGAFTTTTVEFSKELKKDVVEFVGDNASKKEIAKVSMHLDRVRKKAGITAAARVLTHNSFPKGAGMASSASGFAALTVAAVAAAQPHPGGVMSEKELSILARIGSGSACRSIPDGFVLWEKGDASENSYAHSLYPANYWNLCDIVCVVETGMKKITTTDGMEKADTSPFFKSRLEFIKTETTEMLAAFKHKDFEKLGLLIEQEAINMHAVMMTQVPPLFYWKETTMVIIAGVTTWKNEGLPVYFTIDAGPNVHLICEKKDEEKVVTLVKKVKGVQNIIVNNVAGGTKLSTKHLF